jgi:predicted ATPase
MTSATRGIRAVGFPASLTTLIGREPDVTEVRSLLQIPDNHLVCLTGPGGVGKTRLAIEVAIKLAPEFQDGAIFVPLASIVDPNHVASAIAGAIDVRERSDQLLADTLSHELSTWSALLVLDNFEHVDPAAMLISQLLESCPDLTMLITSRSALRIRGEHVYPVSPLAVPNSKSSSSLGELKTVPSVLLFAERARAARSDFELSAANSLDVARICRRLDGLPLAIELAAAWSRVLTPSELLQRLNQRLLELGGGPRDAPKRHQTIRDTIAWSHNLLDPTDQAFFGKLGVFSGGWTVEAAQEVAGFGNGDPLDALARLIDVSLVKRMHDVLGRARFTMLETIREYALETLAIDGLIHEVEARHTRHFLTIAERAKEMIAGPDQVFWLNQLDSEQDNIRRVLDRAIANGDAPTALRLGAALWRYWGQRGQLSEGRSALERALAVDSDVEHSLRAAATYHLANLALDLMEYASASSHLSASLALFRELGDRDGIASSLNSLGLVDWCTGELSSAHAHFAEAERIWKSINDLPGVAAAHHNLGWLAAKEGRYLQASQHHDEALRLRRVQKDNDAIAYSIWALGAIALHEGDVARAQTLCDQSLKLFIELGDRQGEAYVLHELARVSHQTSPAPETLRRYHDVLTLRQD